MYKTLHRKLKNLTKTRSGIEPVVFHDIRCGHANYYITKVVPRANNTILAFRSLQEIHCNCLFVIFP